MKKIGITGQSGFIGTHLYNFLGLKKDELSRVAFRDEYFSNTANLQEFVSQCDTIVHLAGLNRHNDPKIIYDTNIELVKKLIKACEDTGSRPHILFASSIQEDRDNIFGKSKKEGREMLAKWAEKYDIPFTGMIIPNVFGPFGHPYYNSVVATFCHQLSHNEEPHIETDALLNLIYIDRLVKSIYEAVNSRKSDPAWRIPHTYEKMVSEILEILKGFKQQYLEKGIFPDLQDTFVRDLFITFLCYTDMERLFPIKLKASSDDRGVFTEVLKLHSGGQVSFSTTHPGITRGNHFHTRKVERFIVAKGKALIRIRRIGSDKELAFELDGNTPSCVDMPVWHTHNIKNVGNEDLYTIFWINEFYDPEDGDTFFEEV